MEGEERRCAQATAASHSPLGDGAQALACSWVSGVVPSRSQSALELCPALGLGKLFDLRAELAVVAAVVVAVVAVVAVVVAVVGNVHHPCPCSRNAIEGMRRVSAMLSVIREVLEAPV